MNENTNTTVNTEQPTNATPADNGGQGEKMFTQEELDRIISDRLARQAKKLAQQPQEDDREMALKAREARLDCREYVSEKGHPVELLDILDTSDADKFRKTVEKLAEVFEKKTNAEKNRPTVTFDWGARLGGSPAKGDSIADAFKPKI